MKSMSVWIWPLVVLLLAAHLGVAFADIPITAIETRKERLERIRREKAREERARDPVVTLDGAVQPKGDEVSLRFNLPGPGEYEGQLTSCRRTPPNAGCYEVAAIRGVNDSLRSAWLEEKVSRFSLEHGRIRSMSSLPCAGLSRPASAPR